MRLKSAEIDGIINAVAPFVARNKAELRLYGSRIDDALKGGDIDLLLLCASESIAKKLRLEKHKILAKVEANIGEQKIDLTIRNMTEATVDPFLQKIISESLILHVFN
jgi:uncharacterized protein